MTQTLEEATKALTDYITGLPAEARAKAEAYQARLDQESLVHPNGMQGVILDHLKHNNMLLLETATELVEDMAGLMATAVLKTAKALK